MQFSCIWRTLSHSADSVRNGQKPRMPYYSMSNRSMSVFICDSHESIHNFEFHNRQNLPWIAYLFGITISLVNVIYQLYSSKPPNYALHKRDTKFLSSCIQQWVPPGSFSLFVVFLWCYPTIPVENHQILTDFSVSPKADNSKYYNRGTKQH